MTARNRLFSRAARLFIPLLAVLIGKTAHLAAASASDAPARAFQSPPAEYRPLVITHAALLNRQDAAAWLGERRAGGSVLDAGVSPDSKNLDEQPWNNPTYLDDPAQFDKLRRLMAQMKQDGRRVWLYDELGYPSGSAGGRVLAGHPELQVEVVGCRTWQAAGSETVQIAPGPGRVIACRAAPRGEGGALRIDDAIDLTARAESGRFEWIAPTGGQWAVCLLERFQPDTWRRHNIPRRNVNILDRRAVRRFIELTHDRYAAELGPQLAEVDAFFTDEPQFGSAEHWGGGKLEATPMVQWCDELPTAFREKKGHDVVAVLPALFHDAGPRTSKIRYDFYDVQSDLVAENYFGQIEDWCREHHVASSGHMLLEESLLFHVMFSGSMLKNWERMDLPGVDLLGASPYRTMAGWERGRFPVAEDYSCKLASSVAHLTGKRGVFTESFALAKKATLRQILGIAAWQFAGGITHMSTYTIQQELSAEDYAALSDFAGRMAVLCRRGRHVADVAVLVPEASVWAAYAPPDGGRYERYFARNPRPVEIDRVFRDTCIALSNRQRDFDCLSESLLARTEVREGGLHLGGESFRTLVVPEARMLGAEAWNKLRAFLSSGGRAAFVGGLPCQRPECGDDPAFTEETRKLFAEYPDRTVHIADLDRLSELPGWIEGRVPAEVHWDGPAAVRILRRQEPSLEIVLVANPSGAAAAGRLTAPASGAASIWNPETGEIVEVGRLAKGQAAAVDVPGQSARFLVVEKEAGNRRPGGDFQAAVGALRRVGLPAL